MPQPWDPFEPRASEWTLKQAGHLLRHASFGFTASQLQQALADGPQKTIDRLLAPPPDYSGFEQTIASLTPREATPQQKAQLALYRMLHTPYPLHERAVLAGSKPETVATWLLATTNLSLPPITDADKLISTILRSHAFFSLPNYRQKVKSPLEYALNLAIALDVELAPAQLQTQLAALGQNLMAQPTARHRWLNPYTIVARSNLAATILSKVDRLPDTRTLVATLLQNEAPPSILQSLSQLEGRELAQAIANLPEFQLL